MAVPQITIRLEQSTKDRFEAYASALGLMASELVKLLVVRERQRKRLRKEAPPAKTRRARGDNRPLPTVTAHLSSVSEVLEFDAYAHQCGLNRNGAGAWLIETELGERWLERTIGKD